jgi:hypothetical protein
LFFHLLAQIEWDEQAIAFQVIVGGPNPVNVSLCH